MKIYFLITLICLYSTAIFAQHCPFDGANLIVVNLTDQNDKPIKNAKISLQEIDNPNAESCSNAKGLLNKEFKPTKSVLDNLYKSSNIANQYCADCNFLDDGFYAVSLNMSEERCMIKDGNEYKSEKRKFEINVDDKAFRVKKEDIHSLCLGVGKWSRIKPINLTVKVDEKTNQNQKLANLFFEKGVRDYQDGLYQFAIVQFSKGIKLLGEDSGFEPFFFRALSYSKAKKHQLALNDLNIALKLNPNSAEAYFFRAEQFFFLKKYATAVDNYTKSIELNPNNSKAYLERAKAYQKLGKIQLANDDKLKAESLQTLNVRQYDMKGCVRLWFEEKFIKNQTDFLQAIRNDVSREKCLQDLEKIDFDKNSLFGISMNTGYCRYPNGLKWQAVENKAIKEFQINISYIKPNGVCRALSRYDLWLLLPKIPADYQLKTEVSAVEK